MSTINTIYPFRTVIHRDQLPMARWKPKYPMRNQKVQQFIRHQGPLSKFGRMVQFLHRTSQQYRESNGESRVHSRNRNSFLVRMVAFRCKNYLAPTSVQLSCRKTKSIFVTSPPDHNDTGRPSSPDRPLQDNPLFAS